MEKFEYLTDIVLFTDLDKKLHTFGFGGWELVAIMDYSEHNYLLVFKRRQSLK